MSHPCNQFSCPEWNQGECFGGGCSRNPMPERKQDIDNDDEACEEEEEE